MQPKPHREPAGSPAVAVFDADAPPALAFTRALGRAGVPVHVYSHSRWPAARLSRFARAFHACPDVEDADRFLPWLREEVASGRIGLVAPTSDAVAFFLAEIADVASEALLRATPSPEATRTALFKDRFDAACRSQGIRTPAAVYPRSIEELADSAGALRYPVLIKPRSHVGVGSVRGDVVANADDLRARYRPYAAAPGQASVFARYPELAWPLVQEYVPGALGALYSVSGALGPAGESLAGIASRKASQWPPTLGVGTLFEPCRDAALVARGVAVARAILGRGLFELELIHDPRTGEHVAIDLNPRAYGQIRFDLARGVNLPLLWYRCAVGPTPEPAVEDESDVVWVHGIPFHVGRIVGVLRGPERLRRLREYARSLARRQVDIVHDLGDPLSSAAYAVGMFRHPGGLVRPFLRENPTGETPVPATAEPVQP